MGDTVKARLQFVTWLKETYPELYAQAMADTEEWRQAKANEQANPATIEGLASLSDGTTETTSFWGKFVDGLTQLATGALALKTQKAILETNITRAQQGLPPIDMQAGAPTIRTQIDVSPEIAARLQESAMEGTKKMMLYGGIALGAFLLFKTLGGRR